MTLLSGNFMFSEQFRELSERSVLVAFWGAFLVCAVASAVPPPYGYVAGALTQFALLVVWMGYSLAVYWCLSPHRFRAAWLVLLALGPLVAAALAQLTQDLESAGLWSLLIAPLFVAPFGAAARALRAGERKSLGQARTNVFVAGFAFFALPFLAGFIHSRVRAAIGGLQREPVN